MTATALSTMVQFRSNPIVVVLANGIYGFEQFLLDASFFSNPANAPKPYVVLNNRDFAGFAKGLACSSRETSTRQSRPMGRLPPPGCSTARR
jgi:indolepyruvate decarboxylase